MIFISNTTCFSAEGAIVPSSGTNSLLAEFAILEFADTNIIKVFITKKYAQRKTSHTLKKPNVFELPDNKKNEKLFSKYELFFWDQANFYSNSFQVLMLQYPILRASLPPSPFLSNLTPANWNPSSTQYLSSTSLASLFLY